MSFNSQQTANGSIFAEIAAIRDMIQKIENVHQEPTPPKEALLKLPVTAPGSDKTAEQPKKEIKPAIEVPEEKTAIKPIIVQKEEQLKMGGIKSFSEKNKETINLYRHKLKDLEDHTNLFQADAEFETVQKISFEELTAPKGYHKVEHTHAKGKNRYANIMPFKHNAIGGSNSEEYVNASPISVGGIDYLASQGPLPHTVADFLKMAVNGGSNTIVTLVMHQEENASGFVKDKCAPYWHDNKLPYHLPDGSVFDMVSQKPILTDNGEQEIWHRVFVIQKKGQEPQYLTQFHYYHWPDFGEPNELAFDTLIDAVNAHKPKGPIVVHCSAGVGRTGTFIGAHSCIEEAKAKISQGQPADAVEVNVLERIMEMRTQRDGMVQNSSQLMAIKDALVRFYNKEKTKT